MNKKIFFILLFLFSLLLSPIKSFSLVWKISVDYLYNHPQKNAAYKLVNNIPIKYFIEERYKTVETNNDKEDTSQKIEKEIINTVEKEKRFKYFDEIIQNGFNAWLRDTKKMIQDDGREQEFADIMPFLNKKVLTEKVTKKENADIAFIFTDAKDMMQECCPGKNNCGGCFRVRDIVLENPFISNKERILSTAIHEIGHYYGLGDEYMETRSSHEDYVYSSSAADRTLMGTSVMAADNSNSLLCDDVDGFINLLDLVLSKQNNNQFSQRAEKGWDSFCNGKQIPFYEKPYKDAFYQKSKVLNKPNRFNSRDLSLIKFDEAGDVKEQLFFDPLDFTDKEVTERNDRGLISEVKDTENEVKFIYFYKPGKIIIYGNYCGPNENLNIEPYLKPLNCIRSESNSYWECDILESRILIALKGENCLSNEDGIIFNFDRENNFNVHLIKGQARVNTASPYTKKVLSYYYLYLGSDFYIDSDICKVTVPYKNDYDNEISFDFKTEKINIKNKRKLDKFWEEILPDYVEYKEEYLEDFKNKCIALKEDVERHKGRCRFFRDTEKYYGL